MVFTDFYLFIPQDEDPVISLISHDYLEAKDGREVSHQNARIRISCDDCTAEVSLNRKALKKLIVLAKIFLERRQDVIFGKDEVLIGNDLFEMEMMSPGEALEQLA
jgi:hypothetical protein